MHENMDVKRFVLNSSDRQCCDHQATKFDALSLRQKCRKLQRVSITEGAGIAWLLSDRNEGWTRKKL